MTLSFPLSAAAIGVVAFLASLALTPAVGALARCVGAVAKPKADRWHTRPTPMMGGVAIVFAVIIPLLLFLPASRETIILITASVALSVLGLVDDFLRIKPYQKLIGQLLAAGVVIYFGLFLPWTSSYAVNVAITVFWLVGITNAVNMLDNMDGLAAGVSAIAALFLGLNFYTNQQWTAALMLLGFAAALIGFLVHNHHPASIFMGDVGSMFVGFFLACSGLVNQEVGGRSRSLAAVLAVPVLVMVVPIFDTTLVTLMRKIAGRAASQGGRDHTSHRLVALGLSERVAVWMLYSFAIAAGLLALVVRHSAIDISVGAIAAFTVLLTLVGVYLARVRVYDESELDATRGRSLFAFLVDVSYRRRIFDIALDVVLIALSYYTAHALVFGPASDTAQWHLFVRTLPMAVAIKLVTLLACGAYRGMWRYASLADALGYARGVLLGSVGTVIAVALVKGPVTWEKGPVSLTPSVFVLDGLLLLFAVISSRLAFRVLRKLFPVPHLRTGRRVVIYGAGDGGELLLRELLNNAELQRVPVAFLDDDPRKAGKLLHGLPIGGSGSAGSIESLCRQYDVEELLVSTAKVPMARMHDVIDECSRAGVAVRRMMIDLRTVTREDLIPAME